MSWQRFSSQKDSLVHAAHLNHYPHKTHKCLPARLLHWLAQPKTFYISREFCYVLSALSLHCLTNVAKLVPDVIPVCCTKVLRLVTNHQSDHMAQDDRPKLWSVGVGRALLSIALWCAPVIRGLVDWLPRWKTLVSCCCAYACSVFSHMCCPRCGIILCRLFLCFSCTM